MDYIYSGVNRLVEPHNYMYTKFEGPVFINKYRSARFTVIEESLRITSGCHDYIDILSRAIDTLAMNFEIISKIEVNNFWANFGSES